MRWVGFMAAVLVALPLRAAVDLPIGATPGERVARMEFSDLEGRKLQLNKPLGARGALIITRDVECPVSQRYEPRIDEISRRYRPLGYDVVLLDMTPHDAPEARKTARRFPAARTVLQDAKRVATALGVRSTAEAFVIDSAGTLIYRGAIDDQYGLDYQRARPEKPWLTLALDAGLRDGVPETRQTEARGCPLSLQPVAMSHEQPVTFSNRVSRVIQDRCQACHRVGGLAPMPLQTFRQVYERRAVIDLMVSSGRMPPWSADPKVGHWANDRSLSPREKADLLGWIKAGAPEGDRAEAPRPRKFSSGWNIGKPDYVISIPKDFKVPAQGAVDYKNFYVKTNLTEDKWVVAVEIKPTQPKVVHHALAYLEEPGRRDLTPEELSKLKPGDIRPPSPSNGVAGFYAATVPGSVGILFPPGMGKRLPKGAWVKVEVHYQPNGAEALDRTQVGFRFAKGPLREVESISAFNPDLKIPPNDPHYQVKAEYAFKEPGMLLSLFPHMHFRGGAFRYDLRYPDGKVVPVLNVPKFDFGWQSYYELKEPIAVPAGSKLLATAWFNNSRSNPWNPDPNRTVPWGLQTTDEMMIGYFDFARDPVADTSGGRKAK